MDSRIPIEMFADFNRCILISDNGLTGSIRFDSAMEAFEASRKEQLKANLDMRADPVYRQFVWNPQTTI
jgi:hypothetical protein